MRMTMMNLVMEALPKTGANWTSQWLLWDGRKASSARRMIGKMRRMMKMRMGSIMRTGLWMATGGMVVRAVVDELYLTVKKRKRMMMATTPTARQAV
jgi:hypothetical protein